MLIDPTHSVSYSAMETRIRTLSESMSNFSSIADVPDHLEGQYGPLGEVFKSHGLSLPQRTPPESNSGGKLYIYIAECLTPVLSNAFFSHD